MAQVSVVAKITALPGKRDDVLAVFSELVTAVQQEAGTVVYAMNKDTGDDVTIWFYELYADEAAFRAHGGSDAMKAAGGQLRDKTAGRPEVFVLELLASKGLPV